VLSWSSAASNAARPQSRAEQSRAGSARLPDQGARSRTLTRRPRLVRSRSGSRAPAHSHAGQDGPGHQEASTPSWEPGSFNSFLGARKLQLIPGGQEASTSASMACTNSRRAHDRRSAVTGSLIPSGWRSRTMPLISFMGIAPSWRLRQASGSYLDTPPPITSSSPSSAMAPAPQGAGASLMPDRLVPRLFQNASSLPLCPFVPFQVNSFHPDRLRPVLAHGGPCRCLSKLSPAVRAHCEPWRHLGTSCCSFSARGCVQRTPGYAARTPR
jgi:hypothetical protein